MFWQLNRKSKKGEFGISGQSVLNLKTVIKML